MSSIDILNMGADTAWMADGACDTTVHGDLWFPENYKHERARVHAAVAICRKCPVADKCLAYALENDEYGIWGATTDFQRGHRNYMGRPGVAS